MSENMKNKIVLHNKNIKAYIFLVHFQINVKTKMNCKTESYFLIMFSMVGRIRHSVRGLRTTGLQHNMYNLYFQCLFEQVAFRVLLELSKILLWSEFTDAITVCADERSRVMYACCSMCSVSIIFLMLWFTVIVWEACPCGKWCLDKDKLLAHILTT